jgi:hypothetical protein
VKTSEGENSTHEETQTVFSTSNLAVGSVTEAVVRSMRSGGGALQSQSSASNVTGPVGYDQAQWKKQIVAGSVIGSFMVLVVVVFVVGICIAWRRKVKAEEKDRSREESEMREIDGDGQVRRAEGSRNL